MSPQNSNNSQKEIVVQRQETPAVKKVGRGWIFSIVSIMAVIMIFLVCPGFFAGALSKTNVVCLANEELWWVAPNYGIFSRITRSALSPSAKIMDVSPAIRGFYIWQFRLVKGKEAEVDF